MMRALGGASVRLRTPVASASGVARELGIDTSAYQETQLGPVIVREVTAAATSADKNVRPTQASQIEVLISSSVLDALTPAVGQSDGLSFLQQVEQIVYEDLVFAVTAVSADRFAGVAYLYHVTAVVSG